MYKQRNFATSSSPFQNRRSILSPAVPAHEVDTDFTTSDPRAEYVAAQRLPAAAPAEDLFDQLRRLVRAMVPTAKTRFIVSEEEDGIAPRTRLYKVECYGPEIGAALVVGQGPTIAQAVAGLSIKWAKARRAHAVAGLIGECERLAGEAFTPQAKAKLELEMSGCRYADFDTKAARWRKAAQQYAA